MTLSILHRVSGLALAVGLFALGAWLMAAASQAPAYDRFLAVMHSLPGRLLLIAWSFALFFHLANGVRHLVWDLGYGFEKKQANASAWLVVVLTVVLTLGYWLTFQIR